MQRDDQCCAPHRLVVGRERDRGAEGIARRDKFAQLGNEGVARGWAIAGDEDAVVSLAGALAVGIGAGDDAKVWNKGRVDTLSGAEASGRSRDGGRSGEDRGEDEGVHFWRFGPM